ncbi:MAG TPA: energy transducer TonB [Sphingomonas sp.]|nr:energy transducer TonB [Sphingomonas sp.]
MAYADRSQGSNRVVASVIVAVLLAVLGYAFVTGLAYQYVKKVANKMDTFDVAPPPPPPPPDVPPPPPPPDQPMTPPPVVSPPPIVRTPTPPVQIQTVTTPPPVVNLTPPAPPAPPAPPPPRISKAAGVRGNPGQYFGPDAYPPAAIRAGAQGRVVAKLTVGTNGRVTDCVVQTSSGNNDLDETTCRIARSRVRFTPAQDQNGNPIVSSYTLPVRWVLPND